MRRGARTERLDNYMRRTILALSAMLVAGALFAQPLAASAASPTGAQAATDAQAVAGASGAALAAAPGEVKIAVTPPAAYTVPKGLPTLDLSGIDVYLYATTSLHATTGADGIAVFTGAAAGDYSLDVSSPERSDLIGGTWNGTALGQGAAAKLKVGADGVALTAPLRKGGLVRATVTDLTGAPVAGATVNGSDQQVTDGAGSVIVTGLWPGETSLRFEPPATSALVGGYYSTDGGQVSGWAQHGSVTVAADGATTPSSVAVKLAPGATLSGVVSLADGTPASGTVVRTSGGSTGATRTATTDAGGAYSLQGLGPGDYRVELDPADHYSIGGYVGPGTAATTWDGARTITITGTETVSGVNTTLSQGGAVAGTISGLPAGTFASVSANRTDLNASAYATVTAGAFSLDGLVPGTWNISYYLGGSGLVLATRTVTVTPGATVAVAETARAGGTITGSVSVPAEAGGPGSTYITADVIGGGFSRSVSADDDGTFRLTGLQEGEYRITASRTGLKTVTVERLVVTSGSTVDAGELAFQLGAAARFAITDAQGSPVSGVQVQVYGQADYASGTSGSDGVALVAGLADGRYSYSIYPQNYLSQSGSVELSSGQVTAVAITLETAAIIEATVRDRGQAVQNTYLSVDDGFGAWSYNGYTDSSGVARLQLPTGDYRIAVPSRDANGTSSVWAGTAASAPITATQGTTTKVDVDLDLGFGIGGSVTDALGEPLSSAVVRIELLSESGDPIGSTQAFTDGSGTYAFGSLTPGTYRLSASHDSGEGVVYFDGAATAEEATPLILTPESPTARADIALRSTHSAAVLNGTVSDSQGAPTAGQGVIATWTDKDGYQYSESAVTDDDGWYSLSVRAGYDYRVGFATNPDSVFVGTTIDTSIGSDATEQRVDAVLELGRELSGTVLGGTPADPLGESDTIPLEAIPVAESWGAFTRETVTDGDGHYTLRGLDPNGSSWLSVAGNDYYLSGGYSYSPESPDQQDDVVLELGGRVAGTVELPGSTSWRYANLNLDSFGGDGSSGWGISTDDHGLAHFDLGPVPAGDYRAGFTSEGYVGEFFGGAFDVESASVVTIEPGETTGSIDATLERGGRVTGQLTAGGVPVTTHLEVSAAGSSFRLDGYADGEGRFDLGPLPAGVELTVTADWNGLPAASGVTTVTEDGSSSIDLALDPAVIPDLLRVHVSGADGGTYSGVVRAVSLATGQSHDAWALNGVVQLADIPAGDYVIYIGDSSDYIGGYLAADGTTVADQEGAERLTFVAGETYLERSATLVRAAQIAGTVTDAAGQPVAGVDVRVTNAVRSWWGSTDSEGAYLVDGVHPGDVTVVFDGETEFVTQSIPQTALGSGESRTVDTVLHRFGVLDVNVVDVDGTPVEDVWVEAAAVSGSSPTRGGYTDESGSASVYELGQNPYTVSIRGWDDRDIPGVYSSTEDGVPTPVTVPLDERRSIELVLHRYGSLALALELRDAPNGGESARVELIAEGTDEVVAGNDLWLSPEGSNQALLDFVVPGRYLVKVTADGYVTRYLTADGSTTDPKLAAALVVRGDGAAIDRTVELAREWVDSTTTIGELPETVDYGSGQGFSVEIGTSGTTDVELPVEFSVDGQPVDGATAPAEGGTVSFGLPTGLSVGTHTIEVRVTETGNVRSSSDSRSVTVQKATPVLEVSTPGSSPFGSLPTVTVQASLPSGQAIDGLAGAVTVGSWTAPLVFEGGTATIDLPADLSVGDHLVEVAIEETETTLASTDAQTLSISKLSPVLTLTGTSSELAYTGSLTLTAVLDSGPATPTARFTVAVDGETVFTKSVAEAESGFSLLGATIEAGTHTVTVAYQGDDLLEAAEQSFTITVSGRPTAVTLDVSGEPFLFGEQIPVMVTVDAGPDARPTGQVAVLVDGQSTTGELTDGVAHLELDGVDVGTHTVTAEYAANGEFAGSTAIAEVTVIAAESVVNLAPIATNDYSAQNSASVSVATVTGVAATGTVHLLVDGAEVGAASLSAGHATIDLPTSTAVGTHSVTAVYEGDPRSLPAQSSPRSWIVKTGPAALTITPSATILPLETGSSADLSVAIDASTAGSGAITYRASFGDGSPVASATYTRGLVLTHEYSQPGRYIVRVEAEVLADGTRYVTVRTAQIVIYPDEPLTAVIGDAPSGVVGESVSFDAVASRPSLAISEVHWDFGDGATASGRQASHVYTEPGDHTVTLTVSTASGATATTTTTARIAAAPVNDGVAVTVSTGGAFVQGATVTYIAADGSRSQAATGSNGLATLRGLPDGAQSVFVTAPGYLPVSGTVEVAQGAGSLEVSLVSGEVGASTLDSRQLSYEEIVERGIDVADPENQNVFLAEIHLAIVGYEGPATSPNVEIVYSEGTIVDVVYNGDFGGDGGAGGGWPQGSLVTDDYVYTPHFVTVGGHPGVQWMIIPVKGSYLKEFFEVRMIVQNLASTPFTFEQGQAQLDLPTGLALAPTATPQSLTASMPDIPAGESASAYWTVRGDTEGEYTLNATYTGVLEPTGDPITLTATTEKPLKVWGGSALKWKVTVDPRTTALDPFRITVTMTNQTPPGAGTTVYNPTFEVFQGQNYLLAPDTAYSKSVPSLQPGESMQASYIFYSRLTGEVNIDDPWWPTSFVVSTGGNVEVDVDPIELHAAVTEHLDIATAWTPITGDQQGLAIAWEPVAGVTGYSLYGRHSLDSGDWQLVTDGVRDGLVDARVLAEDSSQLYEYYTVISHFADGSTKPAHRVVSESTTPPPVFIPGSGGDTNIYFDADDTSTMNGACNDVLMLGVAGSGEVDTIGNTVNVFSDRLASELTNKRSEQTVYLKYPARAVPGVFQSPPALAEDARLYLESIEIGVKNLKKVLDFRSDLCPNEKVVLTGYSQGALVISQVLHEYGKTGQPAGALDYPKFGGIYLISNPANNPIDGGIGYGTASSLAVGISAGVSPSHPESLWHEIPEELEPITVTLCDAGDLVCSTSDIVAASQIAGLFTVGVMTIPTAVYGAVHGLEVHTTYNERNRSQIEAFADGASSFLLGMPVPVQSLFQVQTESDQPFAEQPFTTKVLRAGIQAQWALGKACPGVDGLGISADGLLSGSAPADYYLCDKAVSVVGEHAEHIRFVDLEIRSGWAAIVHDVKPVPTVGAGYVLHPLATQVLDANGNPVAGAAVTLRLTGPARFPDGSTSQTVRTDAQGYATSTTPVRIPGEGGTVTATAEVPGLPVVDLPAQEVQQGLPAGLTATVAPRVVDGLVELELTLVNDGAQDAAITVTGSFGESVADVAANSTAVIRLATGSDVIVDGALLVTAQTADGSAADWVLYDALDANAVTLELTASAASVQFGEPLSVTVVAGSPAGPVSSGTVTVKNGDTVVGEAAPDANGRVEFAGLAVPVGTHALTAQYTAPIVGGGVRTATSEPVSVTVTQASTVTRITPSTEAVRYGEKATVRVVVTGAGLAAGDAVELLEGSTVIGSGMLTATDIVPTAGGLSATVDLRVATGAAPGALTYGSHELKARYAGNTNTRSSTSPAAPLHVVLATTIGVTAPPVAFGQVATIAIAVASGNDTDTGTEFGGNITVTAPGWAKPLTAAVVGGRAELTVPGLAAGTHPLEVAYSGDGYYAQSAATAALLVERAKTSVSLALFPDSATRAFGDPVSATVAVASASVGEVAGTVDLRRQAGESPVGTDPLLGTAVLVNGSVTTPLPRLDAGETRVYAVFTPADAANVAGAVSPPVTTTVQPIAVKTALTLSEATVRSGSAVRGTVSALALGQPVGGTVTVRFGEQSVTAQAADGRFSFEFPTTGMGVGDRDITADWAPTSGNFTAAGTSGTVSIVPAEATLVAVVDRSTISVGDADPVLSISVPQAPGGVVSVTVATGGLPNIQQVELSAEGTATVPLTGLAVGSHTVTVVFEGTETVTGASAELSLTVAKRGAQVTAVSPAPLRYGLDPVRLHLGFGGLDVGAPSPTGDVSIVSGASQLGTVALVDGVATVLLPRLEPGITVLTVRYEGDDRYAGSQSEVSITVIPAPVRVEAVWPSTQAFGSVTGTVDAVVLVDGDPAEGYEAPVPSGAVELWAGDTRLGSGQLVDGRASIPLPADLGVGEHPLTLRYLGDSRTAVAETASSLTVTTAAAALALELPGTVDVGTPLTATVRATSPAGVPDGVVTLAGAGGTWSSELVDGVATFTVDTWPVAPGEAGFTASYPGSVQFAAAQASASTTLVAIAPVMTATLRPSAQAGALAEIAVSVTAGGRAVEGTVTATSPTGATVTGALVAGAAVLPIPATLPDGVHVYTVAFAGAGGVLPASVGPLTLRVDREPPVPGEPGEPGEQPGGVSGDTAADVVVAGATQTVVVSGLRAGEVIQVYLYSEPIYLGSATADADGVARLSFVVPANLVPGEHRIEIRSEAGVASTWFTVKAAPTGPGTDPGSDPGSDPGIGQPGVVAPPGGGGGGGQAVSPVPAADADGSTGLSNTGTDLRPLVTLAVMLLVLGAGLVVARWRSRRPGRHA
jgi:PKD repeat protein